MGAVGYTVRGGEKAVQYLRELAEKVDRANTVRVGFFPSMTYPDGTHLATAAIVNNFGSAINHIPARPFFSRAVEDGKREWGALFAAHFKTAEYASDEALRMIGRDMADKVADKLRDTHSPRLSDLTLLLRSRFPDRIGMEAGDVWQARRDIENGVRAPSSVSEKPLEWTGQMLETLESDDVIEVTR